MRIVFLESKRLSLVPWSQVKYWSCVRCGSCCRHSTVQLTTHEWLMLTRRYGFDIVDQGLSGFYIRKTISDRCPFLYRSINGWACRLQPIKPLACKVWPIRIRQAPLRGDGDRAHLKYRRRIFYVYAYPQCPGLVLGKPSKLFIKRILPEFLDIRLGLQREQFYSTSKLP